MKYEINTVKRCAFALALAASFLLGLSTGAQAQRRYGPYYGAGSSKQTEKRYRKSLKRDFKLHQKYEKRAFRQNERLERATYGNSPYLRERKKSEREAFRLHQRAEKENFKQTWKRNKHAHY